MNFDIDSYHDELCNRQQLFTSKGVNYSLSTSDNTFKCYTDPDTGKSYAETRSGLMPGQLIHEENKSGSSFVTAVSSKAGRIEFSSVPITGSFSVSSRLQTGGENERGVPYYKLVPKSKSTPKLSIEGSKGFHCPAGSVAIGDVITYYSENYLVTGRSTKGNVSELELEKYVP
jgi:hypothetical protein